MNGLADSRYRLLKRLGRRHTSQVWLADKLSPQGTALRTVALKTMAVDSSAALENDARRRAALFERETVVTARLEHPNIVRLHDWGFDLFGSTPFFEMGRVQGLSLLDLLTARGGAERQGRRGALLPQDVASIGMQAAAGLHYAHNHARLARAEDRGLGITSLTLEGVNGVAHGNLSAASVMVDVEGEVKLVDWSLARFLGTSDEASTHTCDDVFSLGATLNAALRGQESDPALKPLLDSMMHADREQRPRMDELVERFNGIVNLLDSDLYVARQGLAARVQEYYQEPRRRPRLRLIQGGATP